MAFESSNKKLFWRIKIGIIFLILSPLIFYIVVTGAMLIWFFILKVTGHYVIYGNKRDITPIVDQAIEEQNRDLCNTIAVVDIFPPGTFEYKVQCYGAYDIRTGDVDRCLENERYSCVETIAENKKDPSICTRIEDGDGQGDCLGLYLIKMHLGIEICDLATSSYASDSCKIDYTRENVDLVTSNYCNQTFETEYWRNICLENYVN